MFRSSNPVLKPAAFDRYAYLTGTAPGAAMTISGTINKSLVLLLSLVVSAFASAGMVMNNPAMLVPLALGGGLVGFGLALVVTFKKEMAPVLAPIYAVVQGLAIGAISLLFERRFPGIVVNSVLGTFGVFGFMLLLYRLGVLRATPMFTKVVVFATLGIAGIYLVNLVLRMFGTQVPFLHDSTPLGIGISVVICIVAALNFILDFDTIEEGARESAPKFMEWYCAFGLLVTLVWLYLEMLRLMSKLRR